MKDNKKDSKLRTNKGRATAHAKAAARYRDAGQLYKANAHFGRAEHYRSLHNQEFGGFWNLVGMPYDDQNPENTGTRWFCEECKSTSTVINTINSGEECVLPACSNRKTRADAVLAYDATGYGYLYKMACDNSSRMYALSSNVLAADDPSSEVPMTPLQRSDGDGTTTPNPRDKYTPWVCIGCDRVRVIYRAWNDGPYCANPMCTGKRSDAVAAYKQDNYGYNQKFHNSVRSLSGKVMEYNKRLPTNLAEKARVLFDNRLGANPARMSHSSVSRSISFLGEGMERLVEMPLVIKACIDELEMYIAGNKLKYPPVQGLFRTSPSATTLEKLKEMYLNGESFGTEATDRNPRTAGPLEEAEPVAIASLLKWLLGEDIGGPLILRAHETILTSESGYVPGSKVQVIYPAYVVRVLASLPSGNKVVLRGILPFLTKVAKCSSLEMPSKNLARVFAPLLIRPRYKSEPLQGIEEETAKLIRAIEIVTVLIDSSGEMMGLLN